MKKKLLSLTLVLSLCLALSAPALAASQNLATVDAGGGHTGLIDTSGSLWMWGENYAGQLGNGTTENSMVPVKVMDNVVAVSCGGRITAAIKTDGSLWMWGNNFDGALGNSKQEYVLSPIKVMDNVAAVSCGGTSTSSDFTAAIKTDGTLWMWGSNAYGQLGKGEPGNSSAPVKIMNNVAAVSCGGWGHTAAIKTDGSLWMWGDNGQGQLGNGGTGNQKYHDGVKEVSIQDIPVKIMDSVSAVSCGNAYTAAVKTDGSLWTWGDNEFGQLGDGTRKDATAPIKVMEGIAAVSCGRSHTAAIKGDGSLWVWGDNQFGELGIFGGDRDINIGHGDFSVQTTPHNLMNDVSAIACGGFHTIIVKSDGSIWVCGVNDRGQLGNGGAHNDVSMNNRAIQNIPVVLSALTAKVNPLTSIDGGISHTFKDVPADAYYAKAVTWAVGKSITSGTSATTFSPDDTCTVAQIITFLWRANGSPEPKIPNVFNDISSGDYYYKAALWAHEQGLALGNSFNGNAPCTRSMTVTYLWKLAHQPYAATSSFTDVPANADYAKAVAWAVAQGITSGTSASTFSPDATCTRGQIVTFLHRAYE